MTEISEDSRVKFHAFTHLAGMRITDEEKTTA